MTNLIFYIIKKILANPLKDKFAKLKIKIFLPIYFCNQNKKNKLWWKNYKMSAVCMVLTSTNNRAILNREEMKIIISLEEWIVPKFPNWKNAQITKTSAIKMIRKNLNKATEEDSVNSLTMSRKAT